MKIYIGNDHTGYEMKLKIKKFLINYGYDVIDLGTNSNVSVDYPDYAKLVAESVTKSDNKGILICGTGIGVCIAANKIKGIRAATIYTRKMAKLAVQHNNINILCLSSRFSSFCKNKKLVKEFLSSSFDGGRHQIRINKIAKLAK